MTQRWKTIDRTRPLPYPTIKCSLCRGLGWTEAPGSCAADGMQTETCVRCRGEGREIEFHIAYSWANYAPKNPIRIDDNRAARIFRTQHGV